MIRCGIIGYPLTHTLSPRIHQVAFTACELNGRYDVFPIRPDGVGPLLDALSRQHFRGLNVTIPHKQTVLDYLTDISAEARIIGAVNTIVFSEGARCGYNTDLFGFQRALGDVLTDISTKTVLLVGAGGAARAYALGVQQLKAGRFYLANRTASKAAQLATEFGAVFVEFQHFDRILPEVDLVINATAVDMQHQVCTCLKKNSIYFDANYHWVLHPDHEIRKINGLSMLVYQGAESFRLWTGHEPPVAEMMKAVGID